MSPKMKRALATGLAAAAIGITLQAYAMDMPNLQADPSAAQPPAPTPQDAWTKAFGRYDFDARMTTKIYQDQLMIGDVKIPLPAGDWKITTMAKLTGQWNGVIYYLVQLDGREIKSFAILTGAHTDAPNVPDLNFARCDHNTGDNIFLMVKKCQPGDRLYTHIDNYLTAGWNYNLKAPDVPDHERAFGKTVDKMGWTYPPEYIEVGFESASRHDFVQADYLFAPPPSLRAPAPISYRSSEWHAQNIGAHPEKKAVVEKLKKWQATVWPVFQELIATSMR